MANKKRPTNTNGECDSVLAMRNPIIWCFVENGKCGVRLVQLDGDQVTEAAMTNRLFSSHHSQ